MTKKEYILDFLKEINYAYNHPAMYDDLKRLLDEMEEEVLESANRKWIPITSRPMTEEEKEHYKTHPEYQDDCRIFNCKLPDDGQEVLISVCGGVEVDTFVQDANDGCYFEGRDINDVDAWMPLPPSYQLEIPTGAEGNEE